MSLKTDNPAKLFLFSAIGACTGEAITVPVDVAKVRLQIDGERGGAHKYRGMIDALRIIARHEGISALYKGISPALLRQATYGSVRIGVYEPIKQAFTPKQLPEGSDVPFASKVAAGATSGALASGVFTPMDVIKVRMMAEVTAVDNVTGKAAAPRYRGVLHALVTIARTEGLRGLYKGVGPTMKRAAILAGTELSTYDAIKQLLIRNVGFSEGSVKTHFAAGLCAGFVCTVASSPLDVVRSRVMNQPVGPDGRGLAYKSTMDCFVKSLRAEGIGFGFKGFIPNFARIGPHSTVMFLVIEQLRHWFP